MSGRGRGRGRGRAPPGAAGRGASRTFVRPVGELARIHITDALDAFRRDASETELIFPSDVDNHFRAVVHAECKKIGLKSKSYGKGAERRVHVTKADAYVPEDAEDLFDLGVGRRATAAMEQYFERAPQSEEEIRASVSGTMDAAWETAVADAGGKGKKRGYGNSALEMRGRREGEEATNARAARLRAKIASDASLAAIQTKREQLPVREFKDAILNAVRANQVVLVAGSTGCGKTTQVPQYVLDDAWANGRGASIVCTQPRRISAMTVSERIANERGESIGQSTVGYQIRLESRVSADCSLLFCTSGVLLRRLTSEASDKLCESLTHIIIDELHERDLFADFLTIILKGVIPKHPHLKLVLMSATMREDLFSEYFGGCPVISVPGYTHPVNEYHLEDILPMIGWGGVHHTSKKASGGGGGEPRVRAPTSGASVDVMREAIMRAFLEDTDESFDWLMQCARETDSASGLSHVNVAHSTGATALMAAAGKGRQMEVSQLLGLGASPAMRSTDGSNAADWADKFGHVELADALRSVDDENEDAGSHEQSALLLSDYQLSVDPDEVDVDLIHNLIVWIMKERAIDEGSEGAILVFLPGWDEISKLRDSLTADYNVCHSASVLPLHSMVAPADQRKVFQRPPKGLRKIVLSTNIAETAVTIDDVVFVIDSGRLKEKSYDAYSAVSTLQAAWISQASAKQRRGRAGRVRPGECYRVYSTSRYDSFAQYQLPEMQRSPLEELCLQVRVLAESGAGVVDDGPGSTAGFLARAVEPPVAQATDNAVQLLKDIGALTEEERLTRLGRHLGELPLHPRVGKMILYAALFGVLDPILTVACAAAYRPPFIISADGRKSGDASRAAFSNEAGGGSDHLAVTKAYMAWEQVQRDGRQNERYFLNANSLSPSTLHMIKGMRQQLITALIQRGIISDLRSASANSSSGALVRAVLAVGMYPLVGRFLPKCKAPTLATLRGERVRVHAFSVNGKLDVSALGELNESGEKIATLACFDELIRGPHAVQVRECTLVAAAAIVFVCSTLTVKPDVPQIDPETGEARARDGPPSALLVVDNWLRFRVPLRAVAQITVLRLRLHKAFAMRVERPKDALPADMRGAVDAIARVLSDADAAFIESSSFARSFAGFGGGRGGGGRGDGGRGGRARGGRARGGARIPAPRR
jgi:ATP-dependent RNA helicase DHX36